MLLIYSQSIPSQKKKISKLFFKMLFLAIFGHFLTVFDHFRIFWVGKWKIFFTRTWKIFFWIFKAINEHSTINDLEVMIKWANLSLLFYFPHRDLYSVGAHTKNRGASPKCRHMLLELEIEPDLIKKSLACFFLFSTKFCLVEILTKFQRSLVSVKFQQSFNIVEFSTIFPRSFGFVEFSAKFLCRWIFN